MSTHATYKSGVPPRVKTTTSVFPQATHYLTSSSITLTIANMKFFILALISLAAAAPLLSMFTGPFQHVTY